MTAKAYPIKRKRNRADWKLPRPDSREKKKLETIRAEAERR